LLDGLARFGVMEEAIVWCQLTLLARHPDTLIARKMGSAEAEEATRRAGAVLAADWPTASAGRQAFAEFDAWLRQDGNARNPGTTADLVTACLFAALRENRMTQEHPWARDSQLGIDK
jgi:triphosphoribosyl-dephospho-CoA synthase